MKSLAAVIRESGRSYEALARATSIPVERITQLANEGSEPTYAELRALAKALKRSVSDLAVERATEGQTAILFRSVTTQVPAASQVSQRIDQLLAFSPSARSRTWIEGIPKKHHSRKDAEQAARAFREHYLINDQLGPLQHLPQILDSLGVVQVIIHGERIEGASSIVNGTPYIFVSPRFSPRMLFTLGRTVTLPRLMKNLGTSRRRRDLRIRTKKGIVSGSPRHCYYRRQGSEPLSSVFVSEMTSSPTL